MKYFIYGIDSMKLASGRDDLVKKFSEVTDDFHGMYDTELEMYKDASEFGGQARHGVEKYKNFSDAEMLELIDECE